MFRVLVYIILIYLAYQFIFNFLVPVYKTTQQVKKGFREMHDQMNQQQGKNQHSSAQQTQPQPNADKKKVGDYIDFEEIK
ncbi:MAG: hypothetical protein ACHQF0_12185 [Chitinophagales bacterium]